MRVALQPLGGVPGRLMAALSAALRAHGLTCEVHAPIPPPPEAFDPKARQFRAEALLAAVPTSDADRTLAITSHDMYAEGLNFVFGLAVVEGPLAVVSTYRLRDADEGVLLERLAKESVHELGHTWGLSHCAAPGCVMRFSNSLAEADAKSSAFCPSCRAGLPPELAGR